MPSSPMRLGNGRPEEVTLPEHLRAAAGCGSPATGPTPTRGSGDGAAAGAGAGARRERGGSATGGPSSEVIFPWRA